MDYKKIDNKIVLRLKRGDKLVESLEQVAIKEDIKAAHFQGIGACDNLKIGILDQQSKQYQWDEYNEALEIVSLIGNITLVDEKKTVHTHIVASREDSSTIGGHLGEARISFTAEIFIDLLSEPLVKKFDEEISLNLIEFD